MTEVIRVLIADDSELMRVVMKGFFRKFLPLANISELTNLPDTFELLYKEKIDFILLDINMPGGDSNPDTIREIHSIQPEIKVCMFTGNDKLILEHKYIEAGAIGFIQKDENMGSVLEDVLRLAFS